MTKRLRKQGVKGPDFRFYSGNLDEIRSLKMEASRTVLDVNSHDIIPRVLPHYQKWTSKYGEVFLYWFGMEPRICITDVELVKQILSNKSGLYVKVSIDPRLLALLGKGLLFTEGAEWEKHRKVVSPAFSMNKLKAMTKTMVGCTLCMVDKWKALMKHSAFIEVNKQFIEVTADIISHTVFGSSYIEGKDVLLAQQELLMQFLAASLNTQIPGLEYIPTKNNLRKWKLEKKMKETFVSIITKRLESKDSNNGDDLLDLLIQSSKNEIGITLSMDEIIDECKTFFFGGHETTSQTLTWAMFALSTNLDWQEKLREEVFEECGVDAPTADNLSRLKMMHMVLLETLRLYCPVITIARVNTQETKLGSLTVPKNTTLTIPFPIIHQMKELWGDDAKEFNPMRFENGTINAAKHPNALMAFSVGPRACIGQNFSFMEAKIVIAIILQKFRFTLSPDYKHMPIDMLTLQPQFGLPIVFSPVMKVDFE